MTTLFLSQFCIEGFRTPYRLDCDSNGSGILLYVRGDIPSNLIALENKPIESFFVELNLRNDKWLINCSYNPHKNLIDNHLDALSKYLDLYSSEYEKVLPLGDFNADIIKQPTCYKNPDNPTCIYLMLTNAPRSFHNTCVLETVVSGFHLMTLAVMRKSSKNLQPIIIIIDPTKISRTKN